MVNLSELAENQSDDGSSQQDSNLSIQSVLPIQGQANASLITPPSGLQPCSSSMSPQTPISEILPLPKAPPRKYTVTKKRKTGSIRILTNTPVRNEIEKQKQQ